MSSPSLSEEAPGKVDSDVRVVVVVLELVCWVVRTGSGVGWRGGGVDCAAFDLMRISVSLEIDLVVIRRTLPSDLLTNLLLLWPSCSALRVAVMSGAGVESRCAILPASIEP